MTQLQYNTKMEETIYYDPFFEKIVDVSMTMTGMQKTPANICQHKKTIITTIMKMVEK